MKIERHRSYTDYEAALMAFERKAGAPSEHEFHAAYDLVEELISGIGIVADCASDDGDFYLDRWVGEICANVVIVCDEKFSDYKKVFEQAILATQKLSHPTSVSFDASSMYLTVFPNERCSYHCDSEIEIEKWGVPFDV